VFFRLLLYNNSFQYTFKNNRQYDKYYLTFSLLILSNLSAFSLWATTGCSRTDLFAVTGLIMFFKTNSNSNSFCCFYNNICLTEIYSYYLICVSVKVYSILYYDHNKIDIYIYDLPSFPSFVSSYLAYSYFSFQNLIV